MQDASFREPHSNETIKFEVKDWNNIPGGSKTYIVAAQDNDGKNLVFNILGTAKGYYVDEDGNDSSALEFVVYLSGESYEAVICKKGDFKHHMLMHALYRPHNPKAG